MTYTVDNPNLVKQMRVDKSGRLYLGQDYANEQVRISVEVLDDE